MSLYRTSALAIAILLAGCGKPDASGIYVAKTDNEVAMIQLVQQDNGKVSGRIEAITTRPDGTLHTKNAEFDGSVSGHDLLLKPSSAWFGGVQASGTFNDDKLTLVGNGNTLEAQRSTLERYQAVVADIRLNAGKKQHQVDEANAAPANERAHAQNALDLTTKQRQIGNIATKLRQLAGSLTEAVSSSPNFAERAAANSARVSQMVDRAAGLSEVARGQLSVAASQIDVGTNQIEVARSQYAIRLNSIVEDAGQNTVALNTLCTARTDAIASQCSDGDKAVEKFKKAVALGQKSFTPYKQQVQREIERQDALIKRING